MLDPNFREFIELLEKNEVRYLIVGGYAVGFHGLIIDFSNRCEGPEKAFRIKPAKTRKKLTNNHRDSS